MDLDDMDNVKKIAKDIKGDQTKIEAIFNAALPLIRFCFIIKHTQKNTWKLDVASVLCAALLLITNNRDEAFEIENNVKRILIETDKKINNIEVRTND